MCPCLIRRARAFALPQSSAPGVWRVYTSVWLSSFDPCRPKTQISRRFLSRNLQASVLPAMDALFPVYYDLITRAGVFPTKSRCVVLSVGASPGLRGLHCGLQTA